MKHLKRLFTNNWHFNFFYALLLLAAVSLPFTTALMLPIACLMCINWIAEWNWKEKGAILRKNKRLPALIFFTAIYLTTFYGLTISYNKGHAMAYFEGYIWFLTAPLGLLLYSPTILTRKRINITCGVFACSTLAHIIILFGVACWKYVQTGNTDFFFYGKLSIFRHPTYISMYATIAILLMLNFLNSNWHKLTKSLKILIPIGQGVLFVGIICLCSKAAILVLMVLMLIWLFYLCNTLKKRLIGCGILIIFVAAAAAFTLYSDSYVIERFYNTIEQMNARHENPNSTNSTQIRLSTWKSSWEVTKKNMPWGVGTGDVGDELSINAIQNNYKNLIGHRFNAHNQFLQSLLASGVFGLALLLMFCGAPIYYSIKHHDMLYFSFSIIMIMNLLVESMFEVRAGIDFFALFNSLFFLHSQDSHTAKGLS